MTSKTQHPFPWIGRSQQEHLLQFWDQLSSEEQAEFTAQLEKIDDSLIAERRQLIQSYFKDGIVGLPDDLAPAPYLNHPSDGGDPVAWEASRIKGEALLADGKVAAFMVAGGQGSRLGYDGPKGTFPVTPIHQKTLFQVFAEKIRFAEKRYGTTIPWVIMTSPLNHVPTQSFFEEHNYFGLTSAQLSFIPQGTEPAFDFEGNLLLKSAGSLALSPDGHGGAFAALFKSGVLSKLKEQGVTCLSYFQVDNPLVHILDPVFIGFHADAGSEMSSKMLKKRDAAEKVGHFCRSEGKTVVVEYSDMPDEIASLKDESGELRFIAGSIAIHILDLDFALKVGEGKTPGSQLPWHIAVKKIPHINPQGEVIKPTEPNGIKFERFVFDALPLAQNPLIIQTLRQNEFSPVKNAEGEDSPATCHRDQILMFAKWIEQAGFQVERDEKGIPVHPIEISPLVAVDAESFAEFAKQNAWTPPPGGGVISL